MSTIAAGTTSGTALVSTGNTDGTLQLQVNGTTPSVTLAANGAIGVGSTPGYGTNGQVLTSGGTGAAPTWATVSAGWTLGTPVASTSGTAINFTGIPANTKEIKINFKAVSTDTGGSEFIFQLGDSGGLETTGYLCSTARLADSTALSVQVQTSGFNLRSQDATGSMNGTLSLILENSSTNTWCAVGVFGRSDVASIYIVSGSKALSAVLDRVGITMNTGSFDAGEINIAYM
jgi:hypothetical protein